MKQFIEMLRKFETEFTIINEEEIAIPVIAIAATAEQGGTVAARPLPRKPFACR